MTRHLTTSLATVALAALVAGCWEAPPIETQQIGYRGVGMEQNINPRIAAALAEKNKAPDPEPAVRPEGPPASQIYQNVKVLTNLTEVEFLRTMTAMTAWVSPEQGCAYCHNEANLASEEKYAYVVSRRMLQMTQTINNKWGSHVAPSGVTCYTCHRGQPVPSNIWFAPTPQPDRGWVAATPGQNMASPVTAYSSLPSDIFMPYLGKDPAPIRMTGLTALPDGTNTATVKKAESTWGLMMHMSDALGVNCTYCHNTRDFGGWAGSTPQRVTAWYGIRMVRELTVTYLDPLRPVYPASQLGPTGDAPKANCLTCHEGVNKPLLGVNMVKDYPELGTPRAR